MAKLTVSLAACDYDRTRAPVNGTVPIRGCEVIAVAMAPEEAFHRAFPHHEDTTPADGGGSVRRFDIRSGEGVTVPAMTMQLFA